MNTLYLCTRAVSAYTRAARRPWSARQPGRCTARDPKTAERSRMAHGTGDKLVYCHKALPSCRMRATSRRPRRQKWDSDSDSDASPTCDDEKERPLRCRAGLEHERRHGGAPAGGGTGAYVCWGGHTDSPPRPGRSACRLEWRGGGAGGVGWVGVRDAGRCDTTRRRVAGWAGGRAPALCDTPGVDA